jgi:hypothetical protein
MAPKTEIPFQYFKLAKDLQLRASRDPVAAILHYCDRRISEFLSDMGECNSLSEMLEWVANKVGTVFKIVRNDADLHRIQEEFLNRGEKCFANLERDLSPEVFGITYRRQNGMEWEPAFVSVIDCRGVKGARAYFTKWHEIAHLLTLTQQLRLVFRRTHSSVSGEDPEERLMDMIAGRFGFYAPVFHKIIENGISFGEIERLRTELCPEASLQATIINLVRYWPTPCILIKAEIGFNAREESQLRQGAFDFVEPPQAVLRAVRATANDKARDIAFQLFENMRVPVDSVINRVFQNGHTLEESIEDLSWWSGLPKRKIKVEARLNNGHVDALIVPID